jgi:TM2 domain-containing membrane protein YozV
MKSILTLTLFSLSAARLAAQDTRGVIVDSASVSRVALYRDPHRARILGTIIPGAGLFYAGEYLKGYAAFVATGGGLTMGPLIFSMDGCTFALFSACKPGPKWPYEALGAYMVVGAVWTWVSTARDAPHAAERANLRHRAKTAALAPFIQPSSAVAGQWNTGVTVRW